MPRRVKRPLTCPTNSRTVLLGLPMAYSISTSDTLLRWLSAQSKTPRDLFASTALVMARKEASVPPHPDKFNSSKVLDVQHRGLREGRDMLVASAIQEYCFGKDFYVWKEFLDRQGRATTSSISGWRW